MKPAGWIACAMAFVLCGCGSRDGDRILQKRFREMFDGYGTWAGGCLRLASREVVRCGIDTVVLEAVSDGIGTPFAFHPPKDGRIVVFDEPPDKPAPPGVPLNEILFVSEDGECRVVLSRGPVHPGLFYEADGERRAFTWVQFWCRPGTWRTYENPGGDPFVVPTASGPVTNPPHFPGTP